MPIDRTGDAPSDVLRLMIAVCLLESYTLWFCREMATIDGELRFGGDHGNHT